MDPNTKWFLLLERNVHGLLSVYKQQNCDEKKKQTKQTMDIFLQRVTLPQEETWADPSASIPEEAIVITGDDRSPNF